MKAGDYISTPRFCTVQIEEVYGNEKAAREAGFKEPTHYDDPDYGILGKSLDLYHMEFAAYRKGSRGTLCAEWVPHMKAYRLYAPGKPQQTVAYTDSLEQAERDAAGYGYSSITIRDADTMSGGEEVQA